MVFKRKLNQIMKCMKTLQRILMTAVLAIAAQMAFAQPGDPFGTDCDCPIPQPEDVVCAEMTPGEIIVLPSACLAECFGLTLVEDCDPGEYGGGNEGEDPFENDCDCPEPEPGDEVCSEIFPGVVIELPSACLAECAGLEILEDCELVYEDPLEECDCPEPTEDDYVCVETGFGVEFFPSECIAACFGFNAIVDCEDINDPWEDPFEDCDCPEPTEDDFVCVETGFGVEFFPSECIAACFGFDVVVDCEDINDPWEDPFEDCDCPEPTEDDLVCVETVNGLEIFPSACIAACFGYDEVGDCDFGDDWDDWGDNWEDDYECPWGEGDVPFEECGCDEPLEGEEVCALGFFGEVIPFPSACIAECFGFEVVDCDEVNDPWGDPLEDCDCEDPMEGEEVCAVGEYGDVIVFPSECIAECFGFEVVDCEDINDPWEDPLDDCDCEEPVEGEEVCALGMFGEIAVFPSACIAECFGFEVVDCEDIENPWEDGNDCDCPEPTADDAVCVEVFEGVILPFPSACLAECAGLDVVEGDCDIEDDIEGGDIIIPLVGIQGQEMDLFVSKGEINELNVFPNPVVKNLQVQLDMAKEGNVNLRLFSLTGQVVEDRVIPANAGMQRFELDMGSQPAGSYILQLTDASGNSKTERVVKTN